MMHTLTFVAGLLALAAGQSATPAGVPSASGLPALPSGRPAAAPEKTVEQVLDALERLNARKAAIQSEERALVETLNRKLDAQSERLTKLGLGKKWLLQDLAPLPTLPAPGAVGPTERRPRDADKR